MRYCILGGGGSFGIHCAKYLLDNADSELVVGVGRGPLRPEPFSLRINQRERYQYQQFHIVHEQDLLLEYLDVLRPQVIINFAAQGEGAASWRHSWRFFDTNATALCRLYEQLGYRGWLEHFIQIGTSELYGSNEHPVNEDAPIVPTSPYAASKAAFDMYLLAMRGKYVFDTTILRPSNCYCPGQLLHRIVPRAIVAGLADDRQVPLHGGGKARKSYMHAGDLAAAIHLVTVSEMPLPVYNVGPALPVSIRDVAEMCATAVGKEFSELFYETPERPGQDSCYWLDSSAIRRDLGWRPAIDWEEGLTDMVQWASMYLDMLCAWPTDYQLRA